MSITGILSAGSALAQAGSSIYGGLKAKKAQEKANEKMQESYNRRLSDLNDWYNREYHQDFLNTKRGKHLTSRYRDRMDKTLQRNEENAVESGATAEAETATKGKAQEKYSNFLSDITSKAEQRKQTKQRRYQRQKNNLLGQKARFNYKKGTQKAQNWQNVTKNLSNALGGLTNAASEGAFEWGNNKDKKNYPENIYSPEQ